MMGGNVCFTCEFLGQFIEILDGVGVTMFDQLGVIVSGFMAVLMVAYLMYKIQFQHFIDTLNLGPKKQGLMDDLFRNSGALIVATLLLGSSAFWRDYVVGLIDYAISVVAIAVIESGVTKSEVVDPYNPIFEYEGASGYGSDVFLEMMRHMYNSTYDPIDQIMEALGATNYGLAELSSLPAAFMLSLFIFATYIFAALANISFLLILVMHKVMAVLVTGLGPLIILLWVIRASRHYAYSLIRFLLATGSIVIGASFLIGLCLAVIDKSMDFTKIFEVVDGQKLINKAELGSWLGSAQFMSFFGSYVFLFIMCLISVLLGIVAVMAQKPKLEQ